MGAAVAQPRMIEGTRYNDPIEFVVAGGFDPETARQVINAYKAYYGQGKGSWVDWVTAKVGVDRDTAVGIMRRYRKFYGK